MFLKQKYLFSNKIKWLIFLTGLSVVLVSAFNNKISNAQSLNGSDITTSPVYADITGIPGQSVSTNLHIENNESSAVRINLSVEEFRANGLDGQAQIYIPTGNVPSFSWVHFSENSFIAQPNVWNNIVMTIDLPKNASLGYYYAVVFKPETLINSGISTKVQGENAILILLDAHSGAEKESLEVTSFKSIKGLYQYLPATFLVDVKNTGNIFVVPQGNIYISRTPNGPVIASLPINSNGGNILPGSTREFQVNWSSGFPYFQEDRIDGQIISDSNGQPEMSLNWNLKNLNQFKIGKYWAKLVLVYNNGTRDIPQSSILSFLVLPWVFILILIVVLLILIIGIWSFIRASINATRGEKGNSKGKFKYTK